MRHQVATLGEPVTAVAKKKKHKFRAQADTGDRIDAPEQEQAVAGHPQQQVAPPEQEEHALHAFEVEIERLRELHLQIFDSLRSRLEEQRRALATRSESLRRAENERTQLREEIARLEERLAQITDKASVFEDRCAHYEQANEDLSARNRELESSAEALTSEISDLREQSQGEVSEARHRINGLENQVRQLIANLEEVRGEREALQTRLMEDESAATAARSDVEALSNERELLREELEHLKGDRSAQEEKLQALQKENEGLRAAHARSERRAAELEEGLRAARERAGPEQSLVDFQAVLAEADKKLIVEIAAERDRLSENLQATEKERLELSQRLAQETEAAEELRRERTEEAKRTQELREELQQAGAALEQQSARAAETQNEEINRLRSALAAAEQERSRITETLEAQANEAERLRATIAESGKRVEQIETQLRDAEAARRALEQQSQQAPSEAAAFELQAQLADLESKYQNLSVTRERERRSHALEVGKLEKEFAEARNSYEQQIHELNLRLEQAYGDTRPPVAPETRRVASAHAQAAGAGAARLKPVDQAQTSRGIVILDDGEAGKDVARRLSKDGFLATALLPDPEAAGQLGERPIAAAAINVAIPNAWPAVRVLTTPKAEARPPVFIYALVPRAATGLWFGRVETAILPAEDYDIVAALKRLTRELKQVIVVSGAEEGLAEVRKQLNIGRVSHSVVSDRRQALDAVRSVYPQAAIVHPGPSPVDGFRAIAAIRSMGIFRDLPILFLLDESSSPTDDKLLSGGVRASLPLGNLKPEEFSDKLTGALKKAVPELKAAAARA